MHRLHDERGEGVKESWKRQKYLALRRRGAEVEKKTDQFLIVNLCVSASRSKVAYFPKPMDGQAISDAAC
jgi:hypothetical protein